MDEKRTYSISTHRGEAHTLFHVMESNSDDETDWNVVASFRRLEDAKESVAYLQEDEQTRRDIDWSMSR